VPRPRVIAATVLAVLATASQAAAATYYVSPTGSDGGDGSQTAPWRTLAYAVRAGIQPGDVVLLQGGGVWHESLAPRTSGTDAAPITFGSYGAGRPVIDGTGVQGDGGVVLDGVSNIVIRGLEVRNWRGGANVAYLAGGANITFDGIDGHDADEGIHSSPSAPTQAVTVSGSSIHDIRRTGGGVGINIPPGASGWVVRESELYRTGDSCALDQGTGTLFASDSVHDCGLAPLSYATHGLYLKGAGVTVRDSHIWNGSSSCVTVRLQGAVVEHNWLHDCPEGISWYEQATAAGAVTIRRNTIWSAGTGIYIDGSATQDFRIASNTIVGTDPSSVGALFESYGGAIRRVAFEDNVVAGSVRLALGVHGVAAGGFTERANDFAAGAFDWNGQWSAFAAYRAASGQGDGSITADPLLVSTAADSLDATPDPGSPVIDRGVADPAAGALVPTCDGSLDSFCGTAPDMGAVEADDTAAPLVKSAAPLAAPQAIAVTTSVDRVALTWLPVAGASSYQVLRDGAPVATTSSPHVVVARLAPLHFYHFVVIAAAPDGRVSSASASIAARPATARQVRRHPRGRLVIRLSARLPRGAALVIDGHRRVTAKGTLVVVGNVKRGVHRIRLDLHAAH
jgi:nitrous oxidase accessory protein NosD